MHFVLLYRILVTSSFLTIFLIFLTTLIVAVLFCIVLLGFASTLLFLLLRCPYTPLLFVTLNGALSLLASFCLFFVPSFSDGWLSLDELPL